MSTDRYATTATPAPNTDAGQSTATTYVRNELILGPIHVLALPEQEFSGRATRDFYELNVIDGWVRRHEWTDESGLVWQAATIRRSHVRAVLDAAPEHSEFIAGAHLRWITALHSAEQHKRAHAQRRALIRALAHHGLQLVQASTAS